MEKQGRGRPVKDVETKQMNVRIELPKLAKLEELGKTKYMSFSQYVNSLIDKDLTDK